MRLQLPRRSRGSRKFAELWASKLILMRRFRSANFTRRFCAICVNRFPMKCRFRLRRWRRGVLAMRGWTRFRLTKLCRCYSAWVWMIGIFVSGWRAAMILRLPCVDPARAFRRTKLRRNYQEQEFLGEEFICFIRVRGQRRRSMRRQKEQGSEEAENVESCFGCFGLCGDGSAAGAGVCVRAVFCGSGFQLHDAARCAVRSLCERRTWSCAAELPAGVSVCRVPLFQRAITDSPGRGNDASVAESAIVGRRNVFRAGKQKVRKRNLADSSRPRSWNSGN